MGGQLPERGRRHQRHLAELFLFAGGDGAAHGNHDGAGGRGALHSGSQGAPSQHGDDITGGAGEPTALITRASQMSSQAGGPGLAAPGFRELAVILVDQHQVQADGTTGVADVVERLHAAEHAGLVDEEEPPGPGAVGLFDQLAGHIHGPDQQAGKGGEVIGGQGGKLMKMSDLGPSAARWLSALSLDWL